MRITRVDRRDVERAIRMTKSNSEAARYLGLHINNYRTQAKKYKNEDGIDLYELHKNQSGKGVKKGAKFDSEENLIDILEGRILPHFIGPKFMRDRLIREGYFEKCCSQCGFKDTRAIDQRSPLILNFKDFNKRNFLLENLEILCYNCYFINVGDIFEEHQIDLLECYTEVKRHREVMQLEIPKHQKEVVEKALNLTNKKMTGEISPIEDYYGADLIAYNKYKK